MSILEALLAGCRNRRTALLREFSFLFVIVLLVVSCSPSTDSSSINTPTVPLETVAAPTPAAESTPDVIVTDVMSPTPAGAQPPPAGLVYRSQEGLWQIGSDGQSHLLIDRGEAVPSPDLSLAFLWDHINSTLSVIDLSLRQETAVFSDPNFSGHFSWADNQTILLGIYLSPEEADAPSFGHLARLDLAAEQITILDGESLMVSNPAQSPDGDTIAYSSEGPFLYSDSDGVRPFPAGDFTGLSDVTGHNSPAWSPDGRHLAWIVSGGPFGEDPDLTMGLAVYDLEDGKADLLLSFDPARWGAAPPAAVWSPDGQWLALRVFANGPEGSGLWLLEAAGGHKHYLPGVSGNASFPVWSPYASQILYTDYADEDEPPYSALLVFDLYNKYSYPLEAITGQGIFWLEPSLVAESPVEEPSDIDLLCRQVPLPSLVLIDRGDYFITNPISGESCQFAFPGELPGLLQGGGQALFYHDLNTATQTAVVRRLGPDGADSALSFTETGPPSQFLSFIVSPDGQRVAWSASRLDDAGKPVSVLYSANVDGSQAQTLAEIPSTDNRFIVPIRFSSDGLGLFFALQPIGVGGSWQAFSGRYDSLYSISLAGGQPVELFQCPLGSLLCLGDFSGEGDSLRIAFTDTVSRSIQIVTSEGQTVSQFSFPEADYLGYPTFSPGGELAFYVAGIGEHPDGYPIPQPGAIYWAPPTYEGEPRLVKSDDSTAPLIGWLDEDHLVYNSIDPGGSWGTAITSLAGEATIWGQGPTQFITILP